MYIQENQLSEQHNSEEGIPPETVLPEEMANFVPLSHYN